MSDNRGNPREYYRQVGITIAGIDSWKIPMFKFGGWKASLNLGGSGRRRGEVYASGPELAGGGAYRVHRQEFFGGASLSEPPKKLSPSMVKLPPSNEANLKNSKSTNDLSNPDSLPPQLRKSTPDVSSDPRGGTTQNRDSSILHKNTKQKSSGSDSKKDKKQEKDLKAEKKRIAEEKKREKLAAQEKAKQDKLRIQAEKRLAQQQAKDVKAKKEQEKKSKKKAEPPALPAQVSKKAASQVAPKQAQQIPPPQRTNPLGQQSQYSTNTLESSISRSSGPPAYSENAKTPEKRPNQRDATGNTSFGKPIEDSSWDLISAHRQQISRNPVASGSSTKQRTMDLKFSLDTQTNDRNSEV